MASSDLKSAALMDQMNSHFSTDAGKALTKKIGLVYQIHIAPKKMGFQEEIYVVDLKKGEVTKGPYDGGKPDATFSFTDADFFKIATGKMNPQIAFMRGKMKVKGSLSAAQKFTPDIFPKPSKIDFESSSDRRPSPIEQTTNNSARQQSASPARLRLRLRVCDCLTPLDLLQLLSILHWRVTTDKRTHIR